MRRCLSRILDSTHLELLQPLEGAPAPSLASRCHQIPRMSRRLWRNVGKQHALNAYADEDTTYDDL